MRFIKGILTFFVFLFISYTINVFAQETSKLSVYGDIRVNYLGTGTDANGFGGEVPFLRIRPGVHYELNETHSFSARAAYIVSRDLNVPDFSLTPNQNGSLAYDTFSFDEFYYKYQDETQEFRFGRFQKSFSLPIATAHSIDRFQSNAIFVHWTDGFYYKRMLNEEWFSEVVLEYQKRGETTFPYQRPLFFGRNKYNMVNYVAFTNSTRDKYNIIRKGVGLMWAPNAFLHNGEYIDYLTLSSNIVFDFPKKELLNGGSIRVSGELGQNLNTKLSDGSVITTSVGVYNVAEHHNLMIELSRNDQDWLSAPYTTNSDEFEMRYRVVLSKKLSIDARYRIRNSRTANIPNTYSTFVRATYSFAK